MRTMKRWAIYIVIFLVGIVMGISIKSVYAAPKPAETDGVAGSYTVQTQHVYIDGTRYTVVTSSAPSMVIMR